MIRLMRLRSTSDQALIEIAASSLRLRKDRLIKAPLYAVSNVREYWIVNVTERVVEVHRGPTSGGWASVTHHEHAETIAPEAFPDVTIRIAEARDHGERRGDVGPCTAGRREERRLRGTGETYPVDALMAEFPAVRSGTP